MKKKNTKQWVILFPPTGTGSMTQLNERFNFLLNRSLDISSLIASLNCLFLGTCSCVGQLPMVPLWFSPTKIRYCKDNTDFRVLGLSRWAWVFPTVFHWLLCLDLHSAKAPDLTSASNSALLLLILPLLRKTSLNGRCMVSLKRKSVTWRSYKTKMKKEQLLL